MRNSVAAAADARDRRFDVGYLLLLLSLVFLQKIGLNFGDAAIGLDALIMWAVLLWMFAGGALSLSAGRVVLFAAVVTAVATSQLLSTQTFRPTAIGVLLVMYAPFCFFAPMDRASASRRLNIFQTVMLIVAGIVFLQQLLQFTVGHRYWPNLDAIIPASLQYPGFAYIHPTSWNSNYLEPNGVFFLEPSGLSGLLAIALVLEIVWFARPVHLAVFLTAMLASVAASGPIVLALVSPLLVLRLAPRTLLLLAMLAVPVLFVAFGTPWLAPLLHRSGELNQSNSSGYARVISPLSQIGTLIGDSKQTFSGFGAGASQKGANIVQWPFSKLLYEYGLITAIMFHLFFLIAIFARPPSRIVALALALPFLFFGGAFVAHTTVMTFLLLCTLIKLEPSGMPVAATRPLSARRRAPAREVEPLRGTAPV